ncbi:MAG: hypothetical protein SXG53_27785 [Pseudomonadota bacterium]|nr:hypothetical protein [Pseudomonadota bacterium]
MAAMKEALRRHPTLVKFKDGRIERRGKVALAQNFSVQWCEGESIHPIESDAEVIVFTFAEATVVAVDGEVEIPANAVAILPPGRHVLQIAGRGDVVVLATDRKDVSRDAAVNRSEVVLDDRVAPIGRPFIRRGAMNKVLVYEMDALTAPSGANQRLKILQSSTMSVNYVEYSGARSRDALSPHSHSSFEQATLAVKGRYIHHLREEWGANADLWRDDVHMEVDEATLLIIPPLVIHTTEGVGAGKHILIDIFAPPRRDFIAKGWVINAGDYLDPEK